VSERRYTGVGWPDLPARRATPPEVTDGPSVPDAPEVTDEPSVPDEASLSREPPGAAAADPTEPALPPWERLRRASGASVMIAILLLLLGFTLVTQVRTTNNDSQLATARPEDLVRILSDLDAREERLRRELSELEDSKRQLESGAQGREAALSDARRRAEALGILAGTLEAEGPGIELIFSARDQRIKARSVLDAVEELRGAGAEAMQIVGASGEPVRIVATTFFVDSGEGISVDGVQLSAPYMIQVIGDPQTLQPALNIPGGVVDAVRQGGGNVTMRQPPTVHVTALHQGEPLKHARPVS
jgi:uncharacterized protein YlxW (UPF0749 family)